MGSHRAAVSPEEMPIGDVLIRAELVPEGLKARDQVRSTVEVGNRDQHIQDWLRAQSGHGSAPDVMDRAGRGTERLPEFARCIGEQDGPPRIMEDDPNGATLQANCI